MGFGELYLENKFYHYRAGSNWNNKEYSFHAERIKLLDNLINIITQ